MATLQATSITGTLTINGTTFSGNRTLKYQEFTSSGTFTPTAAAISAGGIHHVFIVGGGERGASATQGGCGGEVVERYTTLTNTTGCAVTIGAGGASNGADGGTSTFAGASAGGITISAAGGNGQHIPSSINTSGAGGLLTISTPAATILISAPARTQVVFNPGPSQYWYAYAYQRAYAYAYQSAYSLAGSAGDGYKGFGAGGSGGASGINSTVANSGAGTAVNQNGGSGYCLITWYE